MRRPLVLISLAALMLITGFRASTAVRAQDATPSTPLALSPLLQQLVDAINAGDSSAVAALYTTDGTHEDVPTGVIARGQGEIMGFVDEALAQFRDVRFEPMHGAQAGNLAVLEYTFSVTDLENDRHVTYRGVLIFELDGNLIRRSADYYDLATVLAQLGPTGPSATDAALPESGTPLPQS